MSRGAFFTPDDGPAPEFGCCAALGKVKAGRFDLGVLSLQGRERSVLLCLVSLETAHPADTPARPPRAPRCCPQPTTSTGHWDLERGCKNHTSLCFVIILSKYNGANPQRRALRAYLKRLAPSFDVCFI